MSTSNSHSLHLLRALLRQASYLPDPVARQYFRHYIVNRFKAYQPKENATTTSVPLQAVQKYHHRAFKRRHLSIITQRTSTLQQKAQKGIHYLRRANQGELPCLRKVLLFAYGRLGRRKYALLDQLLKPSPLVDGDLTLEESKSQGSAPLQQLYSSNKRYLQYFDAPKPAPNRNLIIDISDRYSRLLHNVWMRPMPIKRARNNVRRWYSETMTRLLPPLPAEEWDKMYAMVGGTERVSLVKPRTPGTSLGVEEDSHVDRHLHTISDGLKLDKLNKADRPAGMWRPHNITPHFMRRLYSRILHLCCKVEYNQERKQWVAVWGQPIQRISSEIYHAPTEPSLFTGADVAGKALTPPKKPKPVGPKDQVQPMLRPRNEKGEYVRFPFYTDHLPDEHPLRQEFNAWKIKRDTAGISTTKGDYRGR
ncbi:hypothetical protein GQ44DRAFT_632544 [Phaeosphaeriaceae sp. PMI808]|nr:hypothetical protein GQ44DRAFT_632544 [Phaeosphaeriaceae sp. PMI808]